MRATLAIVAAALALLLPAAASAATLQQVGTFDEPISVVSDPADADRLLVAERDGVIVDAKADVVLADLEDLVACCGGERGVLSIALAPDYASSERIYVAYTGETAAGSAEGDIHVDAFVPAPDPTDPPAREPILTIGHASMANHNGGQLQFGPDGYLYVSVGDGGGIGDPLESGQALDTLLGKILRIDPEPGETPAYSIPPGNPFAATSGLDEIWSYGLRNPWRFSFDRETGDLLIADVGQGEREEVNFAPALSPGSVGGAGANYGWNCREGLIAYPSAPDECDGASGFTDPAFDYPHTDPDTGSSIGCSITGGFVVRDPALTDLFGRYVYADYCEGWISSARIQATAGGVQGDIRPECLEVSNPITFGEDASGRVYVASREGGLFRFVPSADHPCGPGPDTTVPNPPGGGGPPAAAPDDRRLRISFTRRAGRRNVEIALRLVPCRAGQALRVRLLRGGGPIGSRRLDDRCAARFRVRVQARSSFVGSLPAPAGADPLLSRRLVVSPPRPRR